MGLTFLHIKLCDVVMTFLAAYLSKPSKLSCVARFFLSRTYVLVEVYCHSNQVYQLGLGLHVNSSVTKLNVLLELSIA